MRLGILGGTFNPIHVGHLVLAETAREALRLDRVLFIPAGQPPHKRGERLLSGRERLRLVRLGIRTHPDFEALDLELRREGPSYTIETVRALRRRWPRARCFLLMGQDLLSVRWAAWEEIRRLCTVVVARRPELPDARRGRGLVWLAMPQLEVASSDIRARLRSGRSIRYLVPAAVERYLLARRCYR